MPSARYTREIPQRYRLEAGKCSSCGKIYYPPRRVCVCGGREFETVTLPDAGLDGGVRLMAQIVDAPLEEIKTGMPVRLEFRKIYQEGEAGIICYGHKAVPA